MSKPLLLVSVGPRAHADLEEPAIPQRAPPGPTVNHLGSRRVNEIFQ